MKKQWFLECCLLFCVSALVLLIAGCSTPGGTRSSGSTASTGNSGATTPPTAGNTGPNTAVPERPSAGAAALGQGIAAFNLGDYGVAERRLTESFKLGLTNTPDLLRGHKTQAFVYCVTARTAMCEKSFEAALNIDRKFALSPAERQQPAWSQVFAKVQKRYVS
jgi:Tfp pilus assembly protein PilF